MKKIISLVVVSVFMSAMLWGQDSSDEKVVTLSDVSSFLEVYQDDANYNFIGDSIFYKKIDNEKYDNIFEESAIIYATVLQVNGTIDDINEGLIPLKSEFAVRSIGFAVKDLPGMEDRIAELTDEIENLNPRNDFRGRQVGKVPTATQGIDISRRQLQKSAGILPDLLQSLEEIAEDVLD